MKQNQTEGVGWGVIVASISGSVVGEGEGEGEAAFDAGDGVGVSGAVGMGMGFLGRTSRLEASASKRGGSLFL